MEQQKIMDDMVCWSMTHIQMCGYFIHCQAAISFMMVSTAAMASGVTFCVPDQVQESLLQN
jgi:hypothetical protein